MGGVSTFTARFFLAEVDLRGVPRGGARGAMATPKPRLGGPKYQLAPPNVNDLNHKKLDYIVKYSIFPTSRMTNHKIFAPSAQIHCLR